MNRGVFKSSSVQQTVGGRPSWWSLNGMSPSPQQISPLLPSSSSSFAASTFPHPSSALSSTPCHDVQERAESWSQLLLGEYVGEEDRCSFNSFQPKVESWYHRVPNMVGVKQESSETNGCVLQYRHGNDHEEIQSAEAARYSWTQHMLPVSSPRSSCITSFGSNMLDFSNVKSEGKHPNPDRHSSDQCNGPATGGSAFKKARIQTCSPHSTTFKVRKEKLGDRITVLHQLVSPFGKTDTASVLLEAIGYIRFLQRQIEALSSPYMRNAPAASGHSGQGERSCIFPEEPGQLLNDACMKRREACDQKDAGQDEPKKDLRSRGLCLVPLSCTMHVGSDNGADYWAPAFGGGGFR